MRWIGALLLGLSLYLSPASRGSAYSQSSSDHQVLADEVKEGLGYLFRTLGFATVQEPSDSTQNPNNEFLQIPHYGAEIELRADFSLDFRGLKLVAKPRINGIWQQWEEGSRDGDSATDTDFFVNEWLVRLSLTEGLFASYGRENVQWGPSYLLSPSNPFFKDNGLSNPQREVPGMDFARLSWVPTSDWSLSFLANVDKGRQEFIAEEFERTYALKVDYTTYRRYASMIISYREDDRGRLGAFGGWTFSDALFLYGEGTVTRGTKALYPVRVPTSPIGIQMSPIKDDERSAEGILLMGGSYTIEAGPTLTMEYVFNSEGYSDAEAELYLELRRQAAVGLFLPEPSSSQSRSILRQTLDPGLRLLRQQYLLFQYQETRIWRDLDVIFRYTWNLDDHSSQFNPILQYDVGRNTQIFLIGIQSFGSDNTEFRTLVDYNWTLGLKYTY